MNWTPLCCAGESAAAIFVGDPPLRSLFSLFSSLFGLIYDENSKNGDINGENSDLHATRLYHAGGDVVVEEPLAQVGEFL